MDATPKTRRPHTRCGFVRVTLTGALLMWPVAQLGLQSLIDAVPAPVAVVAPHADQVRP